MQQGLYISTPVGLAAALTDETHLQLEKLRENGLTLMLVEQKIEVALQFAQNAYVMVKGRVVLHDTTKNLLRRDDLEDLYFAV